MDLILCSYKVLFAKKRLIRNKKYLEEIKSAQNQDYKEYIISSCKPQKFKVFFIFLSLYSTV